MSKRDLAIAYSVKKQAAKKKKMMADGGAVSAPKPQPTPTPVPVNKDSDTGKAFSSIRDAFKAKGGLIKKPRSKIKDMHHDDEELMHPDMHEMSDDEHGDIADMIMKKRKFAKGGMVDHDEEVDLEENQYPELNHYDELNELAADHDDPFLDDEVASQPEDSNEHGRDIDSDEHDMVDMIMRKYSKRKPMR